MLLVETEAQLAAQRLRCREALSYKLVGAVEQNQSTQRIPQP